MDVKLVVVGGETKTTEVKLKLPTVVGRGKEVSLTLPHPLVSRRHTEIYEKDGKLFVRDLGSLNGTFVNNERIEDASELPAGHLLTIGTVTFRAVYNGVDTAPVTPKKTTAGKLTGVGTVVATKSATVQIAFIMNPTKISEVVDVSDAGQVMPQKSTFFYPKIPSGLVLYPLD